MRHRVTQSKLGVPRPKRFAIYYLDAGHPRIVRDRAEGLRLLLADLIRDSREVVGIGSDAPTQQPEGSAFIHNTPAKEHVKWPSNSK